MTYLHSEHVMEKYDRLEQAVEKQRNTYELSDVRCIMFLMKM